MDSDTYGILPFDISISPPSISSLSTDVLSLIFETLILTNTSRNEGLPLSKLIRASQVCHDWREITLDSPLLWGRCISLNHPILLEEQWRKEILRRSGKAPLWIQGKMLMEKIANFFFAIIKEEWERVQVLDVILVDSSDMWNGAWAPILRPSPMLQIFKLANEFSPFTRYPAPFLTDHAPQIKIFRSSNISFNLHAPWISHIQELTLRGSFSLPDVLAALRNMRKIRHLQINFTNVGSDVVECPSPVHLPDLEELMIGNCRHRIWAPVLATIASTQCRSFELASNCGPIEGQSTEPVLDIACQRLSEFLKYAIAGFPTSTIQFDISCKPRRPSEISLVLYEDDFDKKNYRVHLADSRSRSTFLTIARLLLSHFASVKSLSNIRTMYLYIEDIPMDLQPALKVVISVFTSLTWLGATAATLSFIVESCDPRSLPNLHTLMIEYDKDARWNDQWIEKNLMVFLRHRRELDLPISLLDIWGHPQLTKSNMDCLEEITGLKVRYAQTSDGKVTDYECGSGRPELLRLHTNKLAK